MWVELIEQYATVVQVIPQQLTGLRYLLGHVNLANILADFVDHRPSVRKERLRVAVDSPSATSPSRPTSIE
jgi:hypothetical protein